MKLKKKVIFGMVAGLFAVATVFNMGMLNENGAGDVSLDAISIMAQAEGENEPINTATCYSTYQEPGILGGGSNIYRCGSCVNVKAKSFSDAGICYFE